MDSLSKLNKQHSPKLQLQNLKAYLFMTVQIEQLDNSTCL